MENQENNQQFELEQLKAQFATLQQQFDRQQIVNDKLMKSSIKQNLSFYKRYQWVEIIGYLVGAVLGLLCIRWTLNNDLGMKLFWVSFCTVCLAIERLLYRKIKVKSFENNDLLTFLECARNTKKLFSSYIAMSSSVGIIIIFGFFLSSLGKEHGLPNLWTVLAASALIIAFFVCVGIINVRYVTKPCDEIIRQIENYEPANEKEVRTDKSQRRFFAVMMVVFLGLDIWGCCIIASKLKFAPWNGSTTYERSADDLAVGGSLEIWEVRSETTVNDRTSYCDDLPFQENDSVVLRLDADTTKQAVLYALGKTTSEGPAISSAVLGGKPMVKKVVRGPYLEGTTNQIITFLTPEASVLFRRFTENCLLNGRSGAVVLDGKVYQTWKVTGVIENGAFFVKLDASEAETDAFCKTLLRQ